MPRGRIRTWLASMFPPVEDDEQRLAKLLRESATRLNERRMAHLTAKMPKAGLVPCWSCQTPQRPGAVHFPTPTSAKPCPGSWPRRT